MLNVMFGNISLHNRRYWGVLKRVWVREREARDMREEGKVDACPALRARALKPA